VVADSARVGTGVRSHLALVIRSSLRDQVREYADLAGLRIAINAPAGGLEVQLVRALERGGLSLDDVTVAHLPFPEMIAALENGSVDGAITVEPFLSLGLAAGSFVQFAAVSEFYPSHQISVMLLSPQLADREELSVRFIRAYLRGVRDYRAALIERSVDATDVVEMIINHTPVEDHSLYDQMAYHDIDPDGMLNMESIENDLRYYVDSGHVASIPRLDSFIDLRFVEAARASIGGHEDS
jgi:NitT/TauT family transport system substrate-binding protein